MKFSATKKTENSPDSGSVRFTVTKRESGDAGRMQSYVPVPGQQKLYQQLASKTRATAAPLKTSSDTKAVTLPVKLNVERVGGASSDVGFSERSPLPMISASQSKIANEVADLAEKQNQSGFGFAARTPTITKTYSLTKPEADFGGVSILPTDAKSFARGLGYNTERDVAGILGALEGVSDFVGAGFGKGVEAVASLGGNFQNPVSEWGKNLAEHYLTTSPTQAYEGNIRNRYNPTQSEEVLSSVGQNVAAMLPSMAASYLTGGASTALNAADKIRNGQLIGQSLFGLQAAGNAAQEAKQSGASTGRALGYGLTSGLLETSIENIAGGIPGFGKGKITEIASKLKANPIVEKALDIAGEGGEEALSAVLTPYIQRAMYDPDAPNATADEIVNSAVMGAVTAGVLQAGLALPSFIDQTRYTLPVADRTETATRTVETPPIFQAEQETQTAEPVAPVPEPVQEFQQVQKVQPGQPVQERAEVPEAVRTTAQQEAVRKQGTDVPIASRTWEDASNRKVNAFQYDHPELRPYYRQAALEMRNELSSGTKGQRFVLKDPDGSIIGYTGVKRSVSEPVEQALDNAKLSYAQIEKAIDDLIQDNGQENYAAAKKLEMVLDDMMTNGYTSVDGQEIEPNYAYIAARDAVNQALPQDSSEYRMSEEEWQSLLGDEPDAYPGPESSVGAAAYGFDPFSNLQGRYGTIQPGENPSRIIDVPKQTSDNNRVSLTARTVMEADATPDSVLPDIAQFIVDGRMSYIPVTNDQRSTMAENRIRKKGYQEALTEWISDVKSGKVSADITAMGAQLYNAAANSGNTAQAMDILYYYTKAIREGAQSTQAARILKNLTPSGTLYMLQKEIIDINEELDGKSGKRGKEPGKPLSADEKALLDTMKKERDTAYSLIRNIHEAFQKQADHGVPVENWMTEVGKLLSEDISKRLARKSARTGSEPITKTIQKDLLKFAESYLPSKRKTLPVARRTAADRIRDYFNNRDAYAEAWRAAADEFRERYKDDQTMLDRAEAFLQNPISYNGVGTDSVMTQAVMDAALEGDNTLRSIVVRSQLGDRAALEREIFDRLNRSVNATGADAISLQMAVSRFLEDQTASSDLDLNADIDRRIRSSMRDVGIKMSDLIQQNQTSKENAASQIAQMLARDYGVSADVSNQVAALVTDRFDQMVRDAAQKKLDSIFRGRGEPKTRTDRERFDALLNMGAFQSGYSSEAARRVFGDLADNVRLDQSLVDAYLNANTDEARDLAYDALVQNVADQIPATFADKWNAWRYLSMLSSPRSDIRNLFGNTGFQPVRVIKNEIGAALERAVSSATGGRIERTKSFLSSPELYQAAFRDYENVADALSGGKYDDTRGEIQSRRTIFKKGLPTKAVERATGRTFNRGILENVRRGRSRALEVEDAWFKRVTYADSLAGYLNANGVTAQQLTDGTVDADLLNRARDYAGREAMKATFNDKNQFSDAISSLGSYKGDNIFRKGMSEAVSVVLPFKRTPANILARGVEYSPVGLAKSLTYDLVKVKQGQMSATEAIDNIASGLTGSGLMTLGFLLAANGTVTGSGGDDEKQQAMDDLTGGQNYALNLPGGGSVTLDWMAPEALPFFMGVQLAESAGESGITGDGLLSVLSATTDPMLEMSMLQSLNDLIDSVTYVDSTGKILAVAGSALISYLNQGIPTVGGQLERTGETKRYSTYTDKSSIIPTDVQYALGKASAKIPGLDYNQIPYIDAWGREEETGMLPIRATNNFLNPAYTSSTNVTDVDKEIQRLYNQLGDGGVVPSRADKSVTVNGETVYLSGDEYVEYAKKKGQTAYNLLDKIIRTSAYKGMSDADKAETVKDIYEYANAVGKAAVSAYKPDGWVGKALGSGVPADDYVLYRATADQDGNGTVTQGESAVALLPIRSMTDEQKGKVWQSQNSSWNEEKNPFTGALANAGIAPETAVDIMNRYSEIDGADYEGGSVARQKQTALSQYLDGLGLTDEQREVVDRTYKFYNMFPATVIPYSLDTMTDAAQRKWLAVQSWGMGEEDYLKFYPIISQSGKKKDEILQDLVNAGMSQADANGFWKIIKSTK